MNQLTIAKKIKDLRTQLGISGPELSEQVGVTQAQISRLENGLQGFRADTLLRFAKAFGVPPIYFFVDGIEAQTGDVIAELREKGLKPSRGLQQALANPAYLRFMDECARIYAKDAKKLDAMDEAAREGAWFPPTW
jgi:transcriptional regulator with XRE-family HTH domain